MKTAKLVLGILSIVFSVLVLFQSCAAGILDTVQGTSAGSMGLIVGILMLAAGIVNIATRNSKGGSITCVVMFGLAGLIGVTMYDYYSDLQIWGGFCLIVCVVNIISLFTQFKQPSTSHNHSNSHNAGEKQ